MLLFFFRHEVNPIKRFNIILYFCYWINPARRAGSENKVRTVRHRQSKEANGYAEPKITTLHFDSTLMLLGSSFKAKSVTL